MRAPAKARTSNSFLWDLLTFDRLLTGPVVHLIYWAGLGVIVLAAFSIAGAAIGLAIKEGTLMGVLLAFPVFIAGILVLAAMTLLWRGFCELYVAIFRISEDLRAIRMTEADAKARAEAGQRQF